MNKSKYSQRYSPYLESRTKRCFDILVCAVLVVPAVILITILSLYVLFIEGRPVFFIQRRVGKNGKLFRLVKIRTLTTDADPSIPSCEYDIDSVVTPSGRFLRRHRLDELPQIFLVLADKMSLVGPRPELPAVTAEYSSMAKKRLLTKPGISGLWQIKASRNRPMHRNLKYDLYYLQKASLWLDIKILVLTVPFVLKPGLGKAHEKDCLHTYNVSLSK